MSIKFEPYTITVYTFKTGTPRRQQYIECQYCKRHHFIGSRMVHALDLLFCDEDCGQSELDKREFQTVNNL